MGDRIKLLYWDGDGYALWYKRMEEWRFTFPTTGTTQWATGLSIRAADLVMLLYGVDLSSVKRSPRISERFSGGLRHLRCQASVTICQIPAITIKPLSFSCVVGWMSKDVHTPDVTLLPDEITLLKAMILELQKSLQQEQRANVGLQQQLEQLLRRLYGLRGEKFDPQAYALFPELKDLLPSLPKPVLSEQCHRRRRSPRLSASSYVVPAS